MAAMERDNPTLKGLLPKVYTGSALTGARLATLIDLVGTLGAGEDEARKKDVLRRVHRYFLAGFVGPQAQQVEPSPSAPAGGERSEIHFVLGFPLGAMNGFDSHPGFNGTGWFDSYVPYTSTLFGLGLSLGVLYESQWYGIGAQVAVFFGFSGMGAFGSVDGFAYLSSESTAPFLGGGFGFLANQKDVLCGSGNPSGAGAMAELQLGVEFGRASTEHLRVQLALEALLPFYDDEDGSYPVGVLLVTRVAF